MMQTYSHKHLKQEHSHAGTVFFGLWVALIIPLMAFGISFLRAQTPMGQFAAESIEQADLVRYPKEIPAPVNQIQVLERNAIVHPDQATRAQAINELTQLRTEWAETMSVPMTKWNAVATAAQNQNKIVVAVGRDLYISNDAGHTFEQRIGVLPGQVNTLAISPANEAILYAGVDGMGFFKSENDGLTWTPANTGIGVTPGARFGITAITINPKNAQNMYIASGVWMGTSRVTWYPLGILETRNGGKTWTQIERDAMAPIQYLFLDGNTLYVVSNGQAATYLLDNSSM